MRVFYKQYQDSKGNWNVDKIEISIKEVKEILEYQLGAFQNDGWDELNDKATFQANYILLTYVEVDYEEPKPQSIIKKKIISLENQLRNLNERIDSGELGSATQLIFFIKDILVQSDRLKDPNEEKQVMEVFGNLRKLAIAETLQQFTNRISIIKKENKIK